METLKAPISVFMSITYRCNFRCRHCAVYGEEDIPSDLDTKSWLGFLEELARLKIFRLRLSGGEPFMREDIWEILAAIDNLPMRLALNTNASLVDRACAERLSRFRKIDEIMVSLDGSCPETHDLLRGEGTFRKVFSGVDNLVRFPLPVSFYCTVNRYNVDDLGRIAKLAFDWGGKAVKFNDLIPEGRGLRNYNELALTREAWTGALRRLRELRESFGPGISGTILDQGDIYDAMEPMTESEQETGSSNTLDSSNTLSGCGALIRECAVRPDGWIVPCDRLPDLKAGHISEGRFDDIWRSSETFTRFRKRREVSLSHLEECRDCSYHARCTGGCPAAPIALYGNVTTRDPLSCYRIYKGLETFHGI